MDKIHPFGILAWLTYFFLPFEVKADACFVREVKRAVQLELPSETYLQYAEIEGPGPMILDTNITKILTHARDPSRIENVEEVKVAEKFMKIVKTGRDELGFPSEFHAQVWVTDELVKEHLAGRNRFPLAHATRRTMSSVEEKDPRFISVIKQLEDLNVGKAKGVSDRLIIAQALFALRKDGAIPAFYTNDKGIYGNLCKVHPVCAKALRDRGELPDDFKEGFMVEFLDSIGETHRLRIVPVVAK